MRSATSLRFLVGIALVMVVFAVGNSADGEGEDARILLLSALTIAGLLAAIWFRRQSRRRGIEAEARRLRLFHAARDPFGILDQPFALFRRTRAANGDIDNVVWGSWRGLEIRAFDYAYVRTGDDEPYRLSCAMAAIVDGWPSLVLRPETLITTIADHIALPDIAFESDEFNRAFEVRCSDRRFASALVDARMMGWVLDLRPRPGFEIEGPWLLAYRPQVWPWEIESVLGLLDAFLARIPRAVRSMYPAVVPPRPDVPRAGELRANP